jgi:hypothetical protein
MRKVVLMIAATVLLTAGLATAETIDLGAKAYDAAVVVEESNAERTVVRFELNAFERQPVEINGDVYYTIEGKDIHVLLNEGEPAVARFCEAIIIPDDAHMKINVLNAEYTDLTDFPIAPSKGNLLRNVNPDDVPYTFGPVYQQASFYPTELASIREPYILRDYRATVIELNALQYNPSAKTLRVYTSVTVEVVADGPGQVNVLERRKNVAVTEFNSIYERRFINYDQTAKYTPVEEYGDMLIITHDAFHTAMLPLVEWKLQKGIKTTIVDVSTIGNTTTNIKNYIQSFYNNPDNNLAWVLLVGDHTQIATPSASGGAADPTYALVAGGDSYPDIFVGRFSAETIAQVETQVQRTIEYEQTQHVDSWLAKGTGIASTEGPGHFGEYDHVHMGYIRDDLLAFTYTEVDGFYGYSATAAQVSSALNTGRGFINYCGHGSTTSWSTTGFNNTNINNLTNNNMLPFIITVACVNGNFNGYTCFAEAWMRATNGSTPTGAIGIYASSINQSWSPPMDAQDESTDLLIAEAKTTFGGICYNGSCKMIDVNGSGGISMYNTWHIFGDPSLQLYTTDPATMTVNHDGAVFFNSTSYEVEVVGVEGALCALYHDGVLYGSAYTNASGIATIDLDQALPIGMDVLLTISAFNHLTVVDTVVPTSDLTVLHTSLEDTKDTLNDYDVYCSIFTDSPLKTDSLFLYWNAGSGWTEELLTATGVEAQFMATIAAQPAGTQVDYYLWATNDAGFVDSLGVFTFKVIDYQMFMEPGYAEQLVAVGDTASYIVTVTNDGVLPDEYTLSLSGNTWETSILDQYGMTEITSTGELVGDEEFTFRVNVVIPSSLEGDFDEASITATSVNDPTVTDDLLLHTVSAGEPWPIPFVETFPSTTLDMYKWETAYGITVETNGLNPPTPPYSANFDGNPSGGDTLTSEMINLKNETNVLLKFYYQRTGGGDSPESGENVWVMYLDSVDTWHQLHVLYGAGESMTNFEEVVIQLPPGAMHAGFRFKIYNQATTGNFDDWFIDDIYVGHPPDYDLVMVPTIQDEFGANGDSAVFSTYIRNKGALSDAYDLSANSSAGWDVTFFDPMGTTPITSTNTVAPTDSVRVIVKVAVPVDAELHERDTTTLTATSQENNGISATATVITDATGQPGNYPWYEPFADANWFTERWMVNIGAELSEAGLMPPSPPYSLCLDGGNDTVVTQMIDLSAKGDVVVSYFYQRGGSGDMPEPGEDLTIDYKNTFGQWVTLNQHPGDGEVMMSFQEVVLGLPADAYHSQFQLRFSSIGSCEQCDMWFVDDIRVDFAASITVSPDEVDAWVMADDSTTKELIISNDGPGALTYNLSVMPVVGRGNDALYNLAASGELQPPWRHYPDGFNDYEDIKGTDDPREGFPVTRGAGGPNAYGYYWLDSDESGGPTFEWIDVSATGTNIVGQLSDDNYAGPFSIGFAFPYFDTVYTELYIGSNGIIGFDQTGMASRFKTPLPTTTTPNNILAWLWDDLNPNDADNPGAQVLVDTDNERCVISFIDYPEYGAAAGDVITAQVVIYPDGTILYQYLTIAPGFDIANCAIGMENADGTDGLEVAYLTGYLHDNLAIKFVNPSQWMTLSKSGGSLAAGEADTIICNINTMDMDIGDYACNVIITSNDPDPDDNPITVRVNLSVSDAPQYICGDANGDGQNPSVQDATYLVSFLFDDGPEPPAMGAVDVDGSGGVNVQDLTTLINFLFNSGPPLNCP